MQFRKYVTEESIFLNRNFNSVQDVLEFLALQFSKSSGLTQEEALSLLEERERLSSTWLGNNTMMPHNHSPLVKGLSIIFIRCAAPLTLETGKEVKYIFSILTSGNEQDVYLRVLQGIGRLIRTRTDELDRCSTPLEMLNLIGESSEDMASPLTAGDLARYWPRAKDSDTLSVAVDQMKRHGVYFLPVYHEGSGRICGVLDLVDLLKAGFPDYVFHLHNLSMLKDFQPVKYFWKNEGEAQIKEYLRDHRPYVIRDTVSYPEIFFMMIRGNRRHLLVVDEHDEMVGIIDPNEIINKMLRP